MPIHDWTEVPSGVFHHFHQVWSVEIARNLNRGILPAGLSALVEQRAGPMIGDVLAVESRTRSKKNLSDAGGVLTIERPKAKIVEKASNATYAERANRVVVRHHLGRIVAVIEILSPGNKDSRAAFRDFVENTLDFMQAGFHVLLIDLFPPTPRDPLGVHKAIWDELADAPFEFPPGKDRILASYEMDDERTAFVEPVGVGDVLPSMPLFLFPGMHVLVPLEPTYLEAWNSSPADMRQAVETGVMPDPDAE